METTEQKVKKILEQIEGDADLKRGKSVNEIISILLNRPMENDIEKSNNSAYMHNDISVFDMEQLNHSRERVNQLYQVQYYHPITSSKPIIGKLIVIVKKFMRKLLKSIILPMVMEQNDFNASVTMTLNSLYNNELVTMTYLQKVEALSRENDELKLKLLEIEKRLNDK